MREKLRGTILQSTNSVCTSDSAGCPAAQPSLLKLLLGIFKTLPTTFVHSFQRVLPLNFSSLSTRAPEGPVVCLPSAPSSSNEPEILLKAISCGNCSRIKWEQEATAQHCLATCCWSPVTSHPCPPSRLPGRAGEGSVPLADSQPGSKAQSGPSPPGEALQPISDNCRAAAPRCHLRPRRSA